MTVKKNNENADQAISQINIKNLDNFFSQFVI